MARCECLEGCIFFNDKMASMPVLAEKMKKRYCLGDNHDCARHMVFHALGRGTVPSDLFPSQQERTHALIAAGPPRGP
jgi:hypothetical protein